jgi:uncharacterized protein YbaR (Trm112 family)
MISGFKQETFGDCGGPQCHGAVRWDKKLGGLVCERCKLLYEVKNDIPIMLVEEVKNLRDA